MSFATQLWQENHDLALSSRNNPFVLGIETGALDKEKFSYYVSQDAFFLEAFARAYTIAAVKVDKWEDFTTLHTLTTGVLEELKLHKKYAENWGVLINNVKAGAATRHYTDFVLATAWGKSVGETLAALTPCMRLYAWLGKKLANTQNKTNIYSEWISTYSSNEIEELALALEALLDKYYHSNQSACQSNYRYAMECERNFFQAAYQH